MPQPPQTNLSGTSINTNEFPVSAPAMPDGLLPAQQDFSAERATLNFTGKEADGAERNRPRNSLDQNVEEGTEHLLKLIASLESCNAALFNKLVQAQRELAALRQPPASTLPGTELADHPEQSCGWERKLTRMGWRPS